MIPVFLSLQVSIARFTFKANYHQLPLPSLTDDAPRDELVNERNIANDEAEGSCEERINVQCSGSVFTVVRCRESSLTACHASIPNYGYQKCKPLQYEFITQCGNSYPTKCVCA